MKPIILGKDELAQVHEIQLKLLKEFDRICRKYKIKYMICGGTLLGAVRHKGFIPWDDDIDVRMERKEYEKFCEVCDKELDSDRFFFQNYKTDKYYPWYFSKLRYNYSRYVRVGQEHLKMNDGIFMDIFVSDGIPDNIIKRKIVVFNCYMLKKCIYAIVGSESAKWRISRGFYKCLNKVPKERVYRALEKISYKHSTKKTKYVADYSYPPRLICWKYCKRKWVEDVTEVEFEGNKFFTTAYYKAWLEFTYGDYMTPPPEDQRTGNNPISIFYIGDKNVQKQKMLKYNTK